MRFNNSSGELGTWIKEQALVVKTEEGLTIVIGCAHPGVVDITKSALRLYGDAIYLVRNRVYKV